jgi:hypothetical protein
LGRGNGAEKEIAGQVVSHNFNTLRLVKKKFEIFFASRGIEMWKTRVRFSALFRGQ